MTFGRRKQGKGLSYLLGSKEMDPGSREEKQPRFAGGGAPHSPMLDDCSNDFVGEVLG